MVTKAQRKATAIYHAKNKAILMAAKSKLCTDCGCRFPSYVMDFDHRNPDDKDFSIGNGYLTVGKKRLLEEIAKCDVVCANCHRIRTWK